MASRAMSTGLKLPFLKDRDFEDEATLLLAECDQQHDVVSAPPGPNRRDR